MSGVKARQVFSYILLPGIIPRVRDFFASGFSQVAFLLAGVYGSVRLLPPRHPYLDPANVGRFGIRHVIGEAANNLVLRRENIDQILIFIATMAGMVLLVGQLVLLVYALLIRPASAAPASGLSYFVTPDPASGTVSTDIAFNLLDQVFGIEGFFVTRSGRATTAATTGTFPWPFHEALHELLQFYSYGLLIVGVLIFLYFLVVVVAETATSGHAFGQRFQNIWVPIRLVVALGLLVPINHGLNSGQYLVLYSAKFGSSFATNAWITFNKTLNGSMGSAANPTGETKTLLARPQTPEIGPMVQAMSMIHACAYAYWKLDANVKESDALPPDSSFLKVQPYFVKQPFPWMTNTESNELLDDSTTYQQAVDFYQNGDIVIVFGEWDDKNYSAEKGNVKPWCGSVRIPLTYFKTIGEGSTEGGADYMQERWFDMIKAMWFDDEDIRSGAHRYMERAMNIAPHNQCNIGCGNPYLPSCPDDCKTQYPNAGYRQAMINDYKSLVDFSILSAWNTFNNNTQNAAIPADVLDRGWAGAGIWYNSIAENNGAFITAVNGVPGIQQYPRVMELVREGRLKANADTAGLEQFTPQLGNGDTIQIPGPGNSFQVAGLLSGFFHWWNDNSSDMSQADKTVTGGMGDIINIILGTEGVIAMRGDNAHIHPLAQLAALGKGLVDRAILSLGGAVIAGGLNGLLATTYNVPAQLAGVVAAIATQTAYLGLLAGLILYYVLPFMPFLYFFFAVATWVKSIFEAMVGVPLWALAHLRLSGQGLSGDSALNGYFLVFEIFLRPILTVFGLVASILILTAQVRILNVTWGLVLDNLTGFSAKDVTGTISTAAGYKDLPQNTVDEFFYTLIYTIIVYMMATASFKLIDRIPDNILRFMGPAASTFSDLNPDNTEGLTRMAAYGGMTVIRETTSGLQGNAQQLGGAFARMIQGGP